MHYNILNVLYDLIWGSQSWVFGKFSITYCKLLHPFYNSLRFLKDGFQNCFFTKSTVVRNKFFKATIWWKFIVNVYERASVCLDKTIFSVGGLRFMRHPVGPTTWHMFYALTARSHRMSEYFRHYSGITVFLQLS